MIYCFTAQILGNRAIDNEFAIQARYAIYLNVFCVLSVSNGVITNEQGKLVEVSGKTVLLRATCEERLLAIEILESYDAILVESSSDIQKIERWPLFYCDRPIALFSNMHEIRHALTEATYQWMYPSAKLFIKSMKKGFSAIVKGEQLLSEEFLHAEKSMKMANDVDGYLLSEAMNIARDSIGSRETRFFIRNGRIHNSSRMIHTLQHHVNELFFEKARAVIAALSKTEFPTNYVLDLAEAEGLSQNRIVVVELNTLTSSLCYVNNSIFPSFRIDTLSYGAEYRLDCMFAKERYHTHTQENHCYGYKNKYPIDMYR